MKEERVFLGLSIILFVVLGAVLFVSVAGAMPPATLPAAPLLLAPRMPTPTPAPLPPGYAVPEQSDVEAEATYPDLIVKDIEIVPSAPFVFNQATIKITIANQGDKPMVSGNNFYVDVYIGGPGAPGSGERGLICQSGTCGYELAGFAVTNSVLPIGCQGFWVGAIGAEYVLTTTVVFSATKSYYVYAQIDTPEEDYENGYVEEGLLGEQNNIYPTGGQQVVAQAKAPSRFTQSTHVDWFSNYASSLEAYPVSKVLTDINGVQITSDASLELGYWEEPPVCWGTTQTLPSTYCPGVYPVSYPIDYNVLEPDQLMNTVTTRNQSKPVVATDGVTGSQNVVVVWEDQRNSMNNPDIYLRWSDREVDVDGGYHYRQDWRGEVKVNDNTNSSQQRNPAAAVSPDGDVVVVWQDNRLYPGSSEYWDLYLQQFYFDVGGLVRIGDNQLITTTVCPSAVETYPDVAVDKTGMFYVVWQSECTQQSSIWASKGQPTSPGVPIVWDPGRYVVDPSGHDRLSPKVDVAYTAVISDLVVDVSNPDVPYYWYTLRDAPVVAVTWHEDRGLGTGEDIYTTYNMDQMASGFAEDGRVNQDDAILSYNRVQDQPAIAVSQTKTDMTVNARTSGGQTIEVELKNIPVPALQLAWRDFRNSTGPDTSSFGFVGNDPDIYYAYAPFKLDKDSYRLYLPVNANGRVEVEKEQKVNLNDNWSSGWQTYVKQTDPAISAWTYPDYLSAEREIPYEVYVAWADSRNYSDGNLDIYMWHYGDSSDGLRNYALNDDAKIHSFDQIALDDYSPDRPPPAWQQMPSIASNIGGDLRLAWADNRLSPTGASTAFDVYFTRTPYELQDYGPRGGIASRRVGAYISRAFDSCPELPVGSTECDATWFKIDYGGVTPEYTWVALQTRFGDTITDVLAADWYPQNLVWAPENAYWIPVRGYLGPGSNIVGPSGSWPQARYAQYRVNMWGIGWTPTLYYVTLFYGRASGEGTYGDLYLPVIFKDSP